jgi:hypothetical protein
MRETFGDVAAIGFLRHAENDFHARNLQVWLKVARAAWLGA